MDSGGHTNKGITRITFNNLSLNVLKKHPTLENFRSMTKEDAELIIQYYWNKATYRNKIVSQSVAESITSWFWGSGKYGLKLWQRMMNDHFGFDLDDDGKIGKATISAINSVIEKSVEVREDFFRDLCKRKPKNEKFLNGWINRLNSFKKRNL